MAEQPTVPSSAIPESSSVDVPDTAEQVREDQVRNAVAFLSHPKVQTSPIASKRSFLERKGLTKTEIDEAFRRAPEGSATGSSGPQPTQANSSNANQQPTPTALALSQPSAPQLPLHISSAQQVSPASNARWTQVLLGASVIAAGAFAFKQLAGPYLSTLYYRLMNTSSQDDSETKEPTPEEVALASATAELRQTVDALMEVAKALRDSTGGSKGGDDVVQEVRKSLQDLARSVHGSARGRTPGSPDTSELRREVQALKAALQATTYGGGSGQGTPSYPQQSFLDGPSDKQQWGGSSTTSSAYYEAPNGNQRFGVGIDQPPWGPPSRPPPANYRQLPPPSNPYSSPSPQYHRPSSPFEVSVPSGDPYRRFHPSPSPQAPHAPPHPQAAPPSFPPQAPTATYPPYPGSYHAPASPAQNPPAGAGGRLTPGATPAADVAQPAAESPHDPPLPPSLRPGSSTPGWRAPPPPPPSINTMRPTASAPTVSAPSPATAFAPAAEAASAATGGQANGTYGAGVGRSADHVHADAGSSAAGPSSNDTGAAGPSGSGAM